MNLSGSLEKILTELHKAVAKAVEQKYGSRLRTKIDHDSMEFEDPSDETGSATVGVQLRQIERNGGYDVFSPFRSSHVVLDEKLDRLVALIVAMLREGSSKSRYANLVPSKYLKEASFKKTNKPFLKVLKNMLNQKIKSGELSFADVQDTMGMLSGLHNTDLVSDWNSVLPKSILNSLSSQEKKRLSM